MEPVHKYIVGLYRSAFDLNWRDETKIEDAHKVFFDSRPLLIDKNNPGLFLSSEFDWGSRSLGAKQTAISILLEITDKYEAIKYCDLLVNECLALLPSHKDFKVQIYYINRWLKSKRGQPDQETDLLFYTKIDDIPYQAPAPEKKSLIIPLPAIKNTEAPVFNPPIQKGENKVMEKKPRGGPWKYPFHSLEVNGYFYFVDPSKDEIPKVTAMMSYIHSRYDKRFTYRLVSAQWAREHNIPVAQEVNVGIVWRIK